MDRTPVVSKHERLAQLNRKLIPYYLRIVQKVARENSPVEAEHRLTELAANYALKKIYDHGKRVPLLVNARAIAVFKLLEIIQETPLLTEEDLSKLLDLVTIDRYFPITHKKWNDDKENNAILRSEAALVIAKSASLSELYKQRLPGFVKDLIRILNNMTNDILYKENKSDYFTGGRTFIGALYLAVKDLKNVYIYNEKDVLKAEEMSTLIQNYQKEISKFIIKFSTTREALLRSLNIKE